LLLNFIYLFIYFLYQFGEEGIMLLLKKKTKKQHKKGERESRKWKKNGVCGKF